MEILAGLVAGRLAGLHDEAERFVGAGEVGRKTALVADVGVVAGRLEGGFFRAWKISAPMRRASEKLSAPVGRSMNSWMSMGLSACAPPLMMFIIGSGRTRAPTPPTYL